MMKLEGLAHSRPTFSHNGPRLGAHTGTTLIHMVKVVRFELLVCTLSLLLAAIAFVFDPGPISFVTGMVAAAAWTVVVVRRLANI